MFEKSELKDFKHGDTKTRRIMEENKTKICRHCKQNLPIGEFTKTEPKRMVLALIAGRVVNLCHFPFPKEKPVQFARKLSQSNTF